MRIDKVLLEKVAKNARLSLTDDEIMEFLPQLSEILELFSKLDELDTKDVKPSFQPISVSDVFRDDKAGVSFSIEEVFLNVKNRKDDYFKGPKAI